MEKLLKQHGLKVTPPRLAILKCLAKNQDPIDAESVYRRLKRHYNLVTIYRNLATFVDKKIVFPEKLNMKVGYYLALSPHHHIVCRTCGQTECVSCDHRYFKTKNFIDVTHQLVLSGICHKCQT